MTTTVHAFHRRRRARRYDATDLVGLIRSGDVSAREAAKAAVARVLQVDPELRTVAVPVYEAPVFRDEGPLTGVPAFVRQHTDYRALPTGHGSVLLGELAEVVAMRQRIDAGGASARTGVRLTRRGHLAHGTVYQPVYLPHRGGLERTLGVLRIGRQLAVDTGGPTHAPPAPGLAALNLEQTSGDWQRGRPVNFVAVDYLNIGDARGAVDALNAER